MSLEQIDPTDEELPAVVHLPAAPPADLVDTEGRLIGDLASAVSSSAPKATDILVRAAARRFLQRPLDRRIGVALADLAVTGEKAAASYHTAPPAEAAVLDGAFERLRPYGVKRDDPALLRATRDVLLRASLTDRYLRSDPDERARLRREPAWRAFGAEWIAVSGEDDSPTRPVNVSMTRFPQYDIRVTADMRTGRVRYVRTGPLTGRDVVLLIHGHSSRLEEYEDLISELADDFTVLAPDLPSSGYSEKQPLGPLGTLSGTPALHFLDHWIDAFVRAVFAEAGAPPDVACIAGGSLGGNMSLRLARLAPGWLRKAAPWSPACVWDSYLCSSELDPKRLALSKTSNERKPKPHADGVRREYFKSVYEEPVPVVLKTQPQMWYSDRWPAKAASIAASRRDREEIYSEPFRQWHWALAYEQLVYSHKKDCLRPGNPSDFLSIRIPTLMLAARDDDYEFTHIYSRVRDLGQRWPNDRGRTLLVNRTGHSIHNERPKMLARFLRGHVTAPRAAAVVPAEISTRHDELTRTERALLTEPAPAAVMDVGAAPATASFWTDWLGLQSTNVERFAPASRAALEAWMRAHPDLRSLRMRAAGAGHSTSSVARPDSGAALIDLSSTALDFEHEAETWWRSSLAGVEPHLKPNDRIVRVRAATRVRDANRLLASKGLALENIGSYDAQHVIGNISTATHGSGLISGPACDFVLSVELTGVVADPSTGEPKVQSFRIEPAHGITDPAKFNAARALHGMELLQDDDAFYSVVVGLGSFGIITALTLRVVPAFWLTEDRKLWAWRDLAPEVPELSQGLYFDFSMTPYSVLRGTRRDRWCLATTRHAVPRRAGDPPERHDVRTRKLGEQLNKFHSSHDPRRAATEHLAFSASRFPLQASASAASTFAEEAASEPPGQLWASASYVVFRTSVADFVLASSAEISVPRAHATAAVNAVIAHAERQRGSKLYHTSPFGIRFTAASRHYLAPQYGRETCTIESPLLVGREGDHRTGAEARRRLLAAFQEALTGPGLDGRPHWGQDHHMTLQRARAMYPRMDRWIQQYRRFNAFGTFNNAFLRGLGLAT